MSNAIVSNVYRYVIDDVINQVRGEFEDMGIDEAILQELQRSWEMKVARSRVANFGFSEENYYDEDNEDHGLNLPVATDGMASHLQYSNAYTGAAASLPALATNVGGIRPHIAQPMPPQQQQQQQQQPVDGYALPSRSGAGDSTQMSAASSVQGNSQYHLMHPQAQGSQKGPDLQLPGRPNIPQNDGATDLMSTEQIDAQIEQICNTSEEEPILVFKAASSKGKPIPLGELPEDIKRLMRDAQDRAIKAGAISPKARISQLDGEGDTGEDDINSDLDDSDDADDDAEGAEEIEHIILCLYDKVTRTKNKWKCVLKDGIMLVNGRDYLFHRASGDFEW